MVDEIVNRIVEWKTKGKSYPYQIQIHLTNYCNLKCIFCPTRALVKELDRKKELSKEEWLRIIKEGNEMKVKEWNICGGGEPFFFLNETMKIMKAIKEYGKYGEVITNGTFFSNEVARFLVEIEWDKIYISLDSPVAKTQNFLRGSVCFEKIINGVKNLVKWKGRLRRNVPNLFFHTVITNKNYYQLPKLFKLAKKLKVNGISLNALNIWKPEIKKLKLNSQQRKELVKILRKCIDMCTKFNLESNVHDFINFLYIEKANVMNKAMVEEVKMEKKDFSSLACYYPWYNISIFADGRTLPCFILKDEGENLREKSLKEIWFGNYFNEIRNKFLENKLKEDCSKCNPWNLPKMKEIRNKLKIR
jgi:MoaA/NifB/PqqE/SkfB family radical SAM enzyme